MADLPTPHDTFFRALFSDPGRVRDFLRDHLPNDIAGRLADSLPELVEGSFVDEALAGSQSDLLLKVELASGGPAFIYLLAEHKSAPDPGLPLQLASYMVRIWKRHAGTSAARLRALPPIVPVVVYHGAANWTVAESLRDMIAADEAELDFLPGSGYILRSLRAMDIGELSRNPALKAGFITLRREALSFLPEIAESLPEGDDLRRQVLEYVLRVYSLDLGELRARLRAEGHNELEAIVGTIAETLLEQGEVRGLAKGEALGLAKGEELGLAKGEELGLAKGEELGLAKGEELGLAKGKAETFLRQARIRFGNVPAARADEVRAAHAATLDRWLEALVVADTLEEVFDPRRRH